MECAVTVQATRRVRPDTSGRKSSACVAVLARPPQTIFTQPPQGPSGRDIRRGPCRSNDFVAPAERLANAQAHQPNERLRSCRSRFRRDWGVDETRSPPGDRLVARRCAHSDRRAARCSPRWLWRLPVRFASLRAGSVVSQSRQLLQCRKHRACNRRGNSNHPVIASIGRCLVMAESLGCLISVPAPEMNDQKNDVQLFCGH
jgi:hypothetical protein